MIGTAKRKPATRLENRLKWRRRAARFVARGLNTRGRPYVQRQWRELDPLHGKRRMQERDRRRYRAAMESFGRRAMDLILGNFRAGRPLLAAQLREAA